MSKKERGELALSIAGMASSEVVPANRFYGVQEMIVWPDGSLKVRLLDGEAMRRWVIEQANFFARQDALEKSRKSGIYVD
jgi:hypothetical protein